MTAGPGDLFGVARRVPGREWVERRRELWIPGWYPGVTWEDRWWWEVFGELDRLLRTYAVAPGPTITREIRYDEADRLVQLYVETRATAGPAGSWGLPEAVLTTADGLGGCPPGGDILRLPSG